MGKRTYETDIAAIALLYRKKYVGSDILSYDKILRFDDIINKNLDNMEATCGIGIKNEEVSQLYFIMTDEFGNKCAVINPNANLKEAWMHYIGNIPTEVYVASEMNNALEEIGLILVEDKIIDRTSYYNELKEKYNLLSETNVSPKFDIFRDWEKISENAFIETYCLSNKEKLILKELREVKRINEQNTKEKLNILKKTKK